MVSPALPPKPFFQLTNSPTLIAATIGLLSFIVMSIDPNGGFWNDLVFAAISAVTACIAVWERNNDLRGPSSQS